MKELSIDEVKELQLEILQDVSRFCESNNIIYTLYFGSLLGAVRHGGYIPWDDDIDIAMPRVHYEKFIRNYVDSKSLYSIINYNLDNNVYNQFAKVSRSDTVLVEDANTDNPLGVNIDIFPIDGIPSSAPLRYIVLFLIKVLHGLMAIKIVRIGLKYRSKPKNIALSFLKITVLWLSKRRIAMMLNSMITYFGNDSADHVMHICFDQYSMFDKYNRNMFERIEKIRFENLTVCVIKERDDFLTSHYGDYMTLPPLEKRVTHHLFKAYKK